MDTDNYFNKNRFFSKLFRRYIEPDEFDFFQKVHAELLYRIRELERVGCDSGNCRDELDRYYKALGKFETIAKPIL